LVLFRDLVPFGIDLGVMPYKRLDEELHDVMAVLLQSLMSIIHE